MRMLKCTARTSDMTTGVIDDASGVKEILD